MFKAGSGILVAMATTLIDRTGQRFDRLLVLKRASKVGEGRPRWLCLCDCGTKKVILGDDFVRKNRSHAIRSCGCHHRDWNFKHGENTRAKTSAEYYVWAGMIQRCTNPNYPKWAFWGGRGIHVCDRWKDFRNFIADMGRRPSKDMQLDRYPDNNGNYEPGNVRWATRSQQNKNRRAFPIGRKKE